jgi:predicted DsbA family dithiol-disulfide isomerase
MQIDIYADIVCPWCYIGWQRLRRAMADRADVATDVRWKPFRLNPEMPPGGIERDLYLATKFGGVERARQIAATVTEAARRDGLPMAYDRIRRAPNTMDAHRLVQWADGFGRGTAMVETLHAAYFTEGTDIGDPTALPDLARRAGLDPVAAAIHLSGPQGVDYVASSDMRARELGIQAVPFFVFDRRYAVAGAQEPAAFLPLLDLAVAA